MNALHYFFLSRNFMFPKLYILNIFTVYNGVHINFIFNCNDVKSIIKNLAIVVDDNEKELQLSFLYYYVKEIQLSGMGVTFPVCEIDPLRSGVS